MTPVCRSLRNLSREFAVDFAFFLDWFQCWLAAFVSERDLGRIYPGMPAEVHTDTPGGKIYKGQIGFISPVAEFTPKTVETTQLRTDLVYRLRIIVENPDRFLKQGMPVTVKLPLQQ